MRGLLKAAILLAPALASAFVVPDVEDFHDLDDRPIADHSFALIAVDLLQSGDDSIIPVLGLRLDVFPSEQACGYGNITLDGQVLPQTMEGDVLKGQGSISTDRKSVVVASWSFNCIKINGQPDSQFLKFEIDFVDGKAMEDVGFSALFRQTGRTEIVRITNDLFVPDKIAANPNPEGLLPSAEDVDYDIESDMFELDWLYSQLHELEFMIEEKQQAIAAHASEHFEEDIKECDSLKCVVTAIVQKVKHTAHKVYGKIAGDDDVYNEEFGQFPKPPFKKPHWKKPHWPKIPFHPGKGKHGNHTCGPPKHGKGNHTHPHPPHHRKPHHWLPICRLPPPHHGPPPHKPPHHGPPHHGPPHHGPPGGHHPPPHHPPHYPPPPHHGPGGHHPPPPPHHDHGQFEEEFKDNEFQGPPQEGEPQQPPSDNDTPPPPFPPPPSPFQPPPSPPGRRHGLSKAIHVLKFVAIGFLVALLLIALHRRVCTPKSRADRRARREERHRRRAYRRAARKHGLSRLIARLSGRHLSDDDDEYEEKRHALLEDESGDEDALSTTMSEEITQLKNAASVVDDMVSAEEGRSRSSARPQTKPQILSLPIPIPTTRTRDYDLGSQIGDGEELPAYEDNDGSEMSSVIADGFRYTPGSTEYSPADSETGGVNDVLGVDRKT